MKNICLSVVFCPLLAVVPGGAADQENLVVSTVDGNLVIIHADGTQEQISSEAGSAVISPDHRAIAFTVVHMQQVPAPEFWRVDAKLLVMILSTRVTTELVHPPAGTGFGQVAWTPDGSAIAYEADVRGNGGMTDDLSLAPFPPERGPARNLGHWYQGFSFSPDGRRIIHAINSPFALEVLDVATGTRTLLHKASNVVWDAKFSPDGKFIAYQKTVGEPASSVQGSEDDEPDCGSPNTELRLYSLIDGADTAVSIPKAPPSVYNFSWSPDSRRLAIELGTEDCDSPSGNAAVFVTSVDQKIQKQISTSSPSVQPAFSPDGSAIAFVDSSQVPARLFRYDLASETRSVIRRASASENDYRLLDWK
jgi:dipeptidyl aminopeptidase/acylaminoacyl peptidase